jgi:MYXO-CTERM domain-containing protein
MSRVSDRIPVPSNGHHPPIDPERDAERDLAAASRPTPSPGEIAGADLRVAVSPGQLAVGFGVVAAVLLAVAGLRRRRRDG